MTEVERFMSKITNRDQPAACWEWTGGLNVGYGVFHRSKKRSAVAHRYAYELWVGPIPAGCHLDHLCRNRSCVNPAHLEPVSPAENNRRSLSPTALNAQKTHCKRGHPFDEANTRWTTRGRDCRACARERSREFGIQKRKAMGAGIAPGLKTHCVRGHEFTPQNTRLRNGTWRVCIACTNKRNSMRYRRETYGELNDLLARDVGRASDFIAGYEKGGAK